MNSLGTGGNNKINGSIWSSAGFRCGDGVFGIQALQRSHYRAVDEEKRISIGLRRYHQKYDVCHPTCQAYTSTPRPLTILLIYSNVHDNATRKHCDSSKPFHSHPFGFEKNGYLFNNILSTRQLSVRQIYHRCVFLQAA